MNYSRIYENLILKAKNREPLIEGYTEEHHIIPKSFFKKNDTSADVPSNLVILTLREHYLAHLLLYKIYQYDRNKGMKMASALFRMVTKSFTPTSRAYEQGRITYIKNHPMKDDKIKKKMVSSLNEYHLKNGGVEIFCDCGCQQRVRISKKPEKVKPGQRYIKGHRPKILEKSTKNTLPFICGCGCGSIGKTSHKWKRDKNYIHGHNPISSDLQRNRRLKYLESIPREKLCQSAKLAASRVDQEEKGRKIKLAKSSVLKITSEDGSVIEFNSLDSEQFTDLTHDKLKYIIRAHNGILKDGRKVEYVRKYPGNNSR